MHSPEYLVSTSPEKSNDFLTVDVQRVSTHVYFNRHSTTEEQAMVVVLTMLVYLQKELSQLTFLLENAKIHGMRID